MEDPLVFHPGLGFCRHKSKIFYPSCHRSGRHVLTTAGYARTYSGLDVGHFTKISRVQIIDREGIELIGDTVETIANAEGLFAHAESVRIRRKRP